MSRGFALILACGALLFSLSVQASPIHLGPAQKAASDITLVRDWCGLGFHRGPMVIVFATAPWPCLL